MSKQLPATPKSLQEAIMNGLKEATSLVNRQAEPFDPAEVQKKQLTLIELHILDFLRQKFAVAYLAEDQDALTVVRDLAQVLGVDRTKKEFKSSDES